LCLDSRGVPRPVPALLSVAAVATTLAACGSSTTQTPPPPPAPTARTSDFPRATGKTVTDLAAMADGQGPVLAPSVTAVKRGTNRFGFVLLDTARKQITGAQVAVYTARDDGTRLRGPYVARSESLAVRPQFESRTTASEPDAAKAVYVADIPFAHNGKQAVIAIARLDGRLLVTNPYPVDVGRGAPGPPWPGQRAIRVHTQTMADVGGNMGALDTRSPPATDLLRDDLADVLGRQPVVLTFATPMLCRSRVCGPVVDIVEQVRATAPKSVAFIHQEIYNDNEIRRGLRPQVRAWRLHSEPWTFVIDRQGRIAARFEGAFSAGELQRAVADVARSG
jgi:hypothetical protein